LIWRSSTSRVWFALALLERLADAHDRHELVGQRRAGLAVHGGVGLAEVLPPLRVADDHVLGPGLAQHRRADLAGPGAFLLPEHVLGGDGHDRARTASATACTAVNGGATTTSTSSMSFTVLRNSFA
jgi:hypothetical protein